MPNKSDKQYDLFVPNKTRPIQPRTNVANRAVFRVAGVATGGGSLIVQVDSERLSYTTIAAQSAIAAAAAAAVQWQADLDAAYAVGDYSVSAAAGDITILRNNNNPLWVEETFSNDATQTLVAIQGDHTETALLHEVSVAGAGTPVRYDSGFQTDNPDLPAGDRSVTLVLEAELTNGSGGAATARWQIWWWYDSIGWVIDQVVGTRNVTEPSGGGLEKDVVSVSAVGAEKFAVNLIDNGAGGPLPAGATFSVWGVIAH